MKRNASFKVCYPHVFHGYPVILIDQPFPIIQSWMTMTTRFETNGFFD